MGSYPNSNETSPSLGVCDLRNCRRFRTLLGGGGGSIAGPRRGFKLDLATPGGAAICAPVDTFEACWGVSAQWVTPRIQIRPRHPWGAAICATVATFEAYWGVQHSGEPPQIQIRPRHPWGLRSAKLSPLSRAAGGASIVGTRRRLRLDLAIPGGAAICETVATFVGS